MSQDAWMAPADDPEQTGGSVAGPAPGSGTATSHRGSATSRPRLLLDEATSARLPHRHAPVPMLLRLSLHLLVLALLVVAVATSMTDTAYPLLLPLLGGLLAVAYLAGPLLPAVSASLRWSGVWLGVVVVAWVLLVVLTPQGIWLAFPLYFVALHLLPARPALVVVVIMALVASGGYGWHVGALEFGLVLGPLLGAAVAIATVLGYEALYRESEARKRLIEELVATREELAQAERTSGRLAERERLAREVHDTLAQGFSSVQLLLRAAQRALPDDLEDVGKHVEHARSVAGENLEEARRLVRGWSPAALASSSLPEAVKGLCQTVGGQAAIHFRLVGEPHSLDAKHEAAVLRVAQAALANITQHAEAGQVRVTLSYLSGELALDVVDDGRGFDPDQLPAPGGGPAGTGYGLAAMRARAGSIGATLYVESAPGRGTAIALLVPVDGEHVTDSSEQRRGDGQRGEEPTQ